MIDALYLLDTGYCRASEASLIRGGARRSVECHALIALIHHTREGWILFDTGYGPRLNVATARFPYRLYRWLLPAYSRPEQSAAMQVTRFGLMADTIRHVIVSHFHPDHIGGIWDFPNAHFVCDRAAWEEAGSKNGMEALRKGLLPGLIPADFTDRASLCDSYKRPGLPGIGPVHDLFEDGTLLLVPLPGHARGQIGLFVPETPRGSVFLVADAAYLTRSLCENIPPAPITNRFADDGRAVAGTVARLHDFQRDHPEVILLPTHCPEAFARLATWGVPAG